MEKFFLVGCQIDEIEIKELLLRRYHTLDFIGSMDIFEFCGFIILAIEKDKKDFYYSQYTALLPRIIQVTGKYMPFNDFYDTITGANLDLRPAEEIVEESREIRQRLENK